MGKILHLFLSWGKFCTCFLETTGEKPSKLEQLFKALLIIPPTSVEAERAFFAAELFATKLRSRLSDKSVSALSFYAVMI